MYFCLMGLALVLNIFFSEMFLFSRFIRETFIKMFVVFVLIEKGADLNVKDIYGGTAISSALFGIFLNKFKLLLN